MEFTKHFMYHWDTQINEACLGGRGGQQTVNLFLFSTASCGLNII